MSQSLSSLLTGGQKMLTLSSGSEGQQQPRSGQLIALEVKSSSGDGTTEVRLGDREFKLNLNGPLPEGSKILARVEEGDQQRQLRLLDTLDEFKKIQTRELMRLIQPMAPESTSGVLDQVRNQLRHRGFFQPERIEQRLSSTGDSSKSQPTMAPPTPDTGAESSTADLIRLERELPETTEWREGTNVRASVKEVHSSHEMTVEINGRSVDARIPEDATYREGDILQLSVVEADEEPRLKVLNRYSAESAPKQTVTSLLKNLSIEPTTNRIESTARDIHANVDESPEKILRRLTVPDPGERNFSENNRNLARQVIQTHSPDSGEISSDTPPLQSLFDNLGIEMNRESVETVRDILREQPDLKPREFLRQVTERLSARSSDPFREFTPDLLNQAREVIRRTQSGEPSSSSSSGSDSAGAPASSESAPNARAKEQPARESIRQLLSDMNRSTEPETVERVREFVQQQSEPRPGEVLEFIRDNTSMSSNIDVASVLDTIENLQSMYRDQDRSVSFPSNNSLKPSDLSGLIKDLDMKPDSSLIELAEAVLDSEERPSKRMISQVLSNRSMVTDDEGNVDQDRLKKLVSLMKQGLKPNEEMFQQLSKNRPEADMARIWGQNEQLPRLTPEEGGLDKQLRQLLQSMGFDLEAQVRDNASEAKDTLRAALLALLGSGQTSDSAQSMTGDVSRNDARSVLAQIVKHSLASRAEDGSVFLFVPFQDGDESRMMKVRVRDERDEEGERLDRQWGVTLEVTLSSLGDLRIHARRREDRLGVRFQAREAASARLIRENRDGLEQGLQGLGYTPDITVERLEEEFSNWVDRSLYETPETGAGSLDLTI